MARTRRWSVALVALLALMFAFALTPTQALAKTGWVKESKGWRYYTSDGDYYKEEKTSNYTYGLYKIDGKWYGFDANGYMQTGWYKTWDKYSYEGQSYEFTDWYYLGSDGAARKGWQKIGGKWYFFDNQSNEWAPYMYADDVWEIDGRFYGFSSSGAMITNSWIEADWGEILWFYANSDGTLATGWKQIGGTWYYFTKGTYKDKDGVTRQYDPVMYAGGVRAIDGNLYFFKSSGAMATGWQKETYNDGSVQWFYLKSSGAAAKGWLKDGGKWYYFDCKMYDDGGWSYYMYENGFFTIGGKTYYFNKSGDMAVGWKQISGKWYYFNSGGDMATNKWVGNYYLKADGTMAVSEWIGKYHVNDYGKWDQTK